MAPSSKQAKRNEAKKERNQPVEASPVRRQSGGSFVDLLKSEVLGSVVAQVAPKFPALVKDGIATVKGEKKAEKKEEAKTEEKDEKVESKENEQEGNEEKENNCKVEEETKEEIPDHILDKDVCAIFSSLCNRLHWSNPLGLATPATGEESLNAWKSIKSMELDFGPRPKRNANPGLDRITMNLYNNLPQYLHIVLALMILRSLLFRSFIACLPWLTLYQFLSVFLPLDKLEKLPQIPLDKIPVEFRILITVSLNSLVQFFFVYEFVFRAWFFEKFFVIGAVVYHAYAVRPIEA